jgi:hypothetical protein
MVNSTAEMTVDETQESFGRSWSCADAWTWARVTSLNPRLSPAAEAAPIWTKGSRSDADYEGHDGEIDRDGQNVLDNGRDGA